MHGGSTKCPNYIFIKELVHLLNYGEKLSLFFPLQFFFAIFSPLFNGDRYIEIPTEMNSPDLANASFSTITIFGLSVANKET